MPNQPTCFSSRGYGLWVGGIALALAVGTAGASPAAEGWSGSLAVAVVGESVDGSEGSYRTQLNLDEGLLLEGLDLRFRPEEEGRKELRLTARGFGGAEPAQSLRADLRLNAPWRLRLDYDRRESFFSLAETDLGLRSDDWEIDRWRGSVEWDGWSKARLALDLRHYERSGTVRRPLFALNEVYPLRVDLDETMDEVAFRLETRDLPVNLLFEQAFATYERASGRRPGGEENLDGDDPDLFVTASDRRSDQKDVPTTRLVASWRGERAELLGSVLWRPAELDGTGTVSEGFAIGGGRIGQIEFVDQLARSANYDTLAGNLRLGFALGSSWVLRLEADHRDLASDSALTGQRLLRVTSPFGDVLEIPGLIDESTRLDVTDTGGRLTLEWSGGGWTIWGGALTAEREVEWRLDADEAPYRVTRDSDGALAGVAWSLGRISGSAEYEHGSFDNFVFRTDPETVDRFSLRLRADLGSGWEGQLRGRFEEADNPDGVAGLDRSTDAYGAGIAWSAADGETGFGLDLDQLDLTTETGLVLPGGEPGLSLYDLEALSISAHGRTQVGRARLSGAATRIDDSGSTWPLESWNARGRVGVEVGAGIELAAFGEYWSYDEERAEGDDFDVSRYGLSIGWRFE